MIVSPTTYVKYAVSADVLSAFCFVAVALSVSVLIKHRRVGASVGLLACWMIVILAVAAGINFLMSALVFWSPFSYFCLGLKWVITLVSIISSAYLYHIAGSSRNIKLENHKWHMYRVIASYQDEEMARLQKFLDSKGT